MQERLPNEIFHLEVRREADLEIADAFIYYERKSLGLGERFLEDVEDCFQRLTANPEQFPRKRDPYREALLSTFPYIIVYEVIQDLVIVYSVFNTWRDPKRKPQ